MNKQQAVQLARLRLANQHIQQPPALDPTGVVRFMTAMQAQDLPGAKRSIALRSPGATLATVDDELNSGAVVRSWPFRGTLHFVVAEDLEWMLDLTATRTVTGAATRHRQLGLDSDTFEKARAVAIASLEGGRSLVRDALFAEFRVHGIDTTSNRGSHLLWYLSHTKTLCFGPMVGGAQALVLLEEWVEHPRRLSHDEGARELTLRYFTSHGPATLRDFLWWSNLLTGDARLGLDAARDNLESLVVDGAEYWMPAGTLAQPPLRAVVQLLPGFDEYLLGYANRTAVLAPEYWERIVPGNNGMFMPTIVAGGRIVGTWSRRASPKRVAVLPQPFEPLSAAQQRGAARAADRYAAYLGVPLAP
ncbi:winged helix DNA-binding domain-containing protein [Subtercola boreus]|uniref:Winged helix DNA-binding domain-containing protein n=1 Tax=Subtercola boreus TaxID=120213 RepID=A0A3E0WDM3_9MICO|nr:winged helix DNA-binding domain-containing protein [Subtercola boreus]RFA21791.1 hypothetical protein B7R24_05770 [Subtercola boreus]RFA21902.1 hypothetical protein B7R23_05715 [Subtercola boreus]RFA27850.1 hypothetical protein B7R25_05840 [Subtercola boreus]